VPVIFNVYVPIFNGSTEYTERVVPVIEKTVESAGELSELVIV
jgi:hypothetical protein